MSSTTLLRVSFIVCFAALQTTLLHLGTSMVLLALGGGLSLSLPALLLTALVAAWAVRHWEPISETESFVRPQTLVACAATVLYAAKIHLGGGWSPLSGWLVLWPYADGSPDALLLLVCVVIGLWAWWRGMALPDSDHSDVLRTLQNGVLFMVLLAIVITPLTRVNLGAAPWGTLFAIQGAAAIGFGLAALSLGRAEAIDSDVPMSRWRLARSGVLAAAAVVGLGVLALTLVSSAATSIVRSLIFWIAAAMAFVLSPLAEVLYRLILWLRSFANAQPETLPVASASAQASPPPTPPEGIDVQVFQTLVQLLGLLLYLLPLLVLVLLILTLQRRRRKATDASGAQHESLWSWRSFGADLRSMLANLRVRGPGNQLRDALARLRSEDPAQRIRRRYVEALLRGEEAKQERTPSQTPLEFQPRLTSVTPEAGAEVASLTETYDRARYAPETVKPSDAAAADAAWEAIRRSHRENRESS